MAQTVNYFYWRVKKKSGNNTRVDLCFRHAVAAASDGDDIQTEIIETEAEVDCDRCFEDET